MTLTAASSLKCALDPVVFAREMLAFQADEWQAKVLRWAGKRMILNCNRQSGKSTVAAILATHTALYEPGALILLVSPSLRQSGELFRKVSGFIEAIDNPPKLVEDNRLSMELDNGSRIISLPSKEGTVRGYSGATLIIEDEASRVDDELYRAMRPMLAVSNGRLILMSTPFGKRGHFYQEWISSFGWERIHITADQCSRISAEFLQEELDSRGEWSYKQEYMGEFVEAEDSVFNYDDIMRSLSAEVTPLLGIGGLGAIDPDILPLDLDNIATGVVW